MKRKLLLAALVVASAFAFNANAREDVTSTYLQDAGLSSLDGWGNPGKTAWVTDGAVNVVEFWNWTNQFNFSQKAVLPAGYYRLAVNAFYRNSWGGDGTNNDMAWIFAGEKTQNVVALNSMNDLSGYAGSNDLYRAATAFSQGKFSNEFDFSVTGEGTKEVEIGFKGTCPNGGWCILGPVTLYQYTAADYIEDYREKVAAAEALYDTPMYASALAALKAAVVDEATLKTVDDVQNAVSALTTAISNANSSIAIYANDIAPFNTMKSQAQATADVEYTETTSGSHDALVAAIAAQQTAVAAAENANDIATAITALKAAVKTYVLAAEPKNEGEYFDVTCLMANPDFDNNDIDGWTKESTLNPNTRIQCNEFFGSAAFDFYQIVEGLPNGSYTLSMRAFQRPGWYDGVYADYAAGINKASAKIYVNNDESDVKNIMAEMNETRIYTDPNGEDQFNSDKQPANAPGYIPNSMEGAAAWFAAGKYQTEVAALVENGTLRLGFKDIAHDSDVWTLFDEFRLHYYGSSKMIYYKQYLPQLVAEVTADKSNALYANVAGKELYDLDAALGVDASGFTTEGEYSDAIDAIKNAQTTYRAAYPTYDALAVAQAEAKLEKKTANIGTGVFQYDETNNNTLYSAYESAYNTMIATTTIYPTNPYATAENIQEALDAYSTRKAAYQGLTLNAPAADKRYQLTLADKGILTSVAAATEGGYGMPFKAENAIYMQAFTLTQVSGDVYNMSFEDANGTTHYVCNGLASGYSAGTKEYGIRTTTSAEDALPILVQASETDGVFYMLNTTAENNKLGSNGGDFYTDAKYSDWTIAEASKATVEVEIAANVKYATRIFPFTPTLPSNVKVYTIAGINGDALEIIQVNAPAANTPYILENATDNAASFNCSGWSVAEQTTYEDYYGFLTGTYEEIDAPNGSYVLQDQTATGGKVGFYHVDTTVATPKVKANRAYLTYEVPAGEAKARAFFFNGEATAIDAVAAIAAGEIEAIYTAGGVKVESLQKGLNIVVLKGGKTQKVFVK